MRQNQLFWLEVVATVAPKYFASCIAIIPTPPDPAWIKTFWPFLIFPISTNTYQAVKAANGMPAASSIEKFLGLRKGLLRLQRDIPQKYQCDDQQVAKLLDYLF